MTPTAPSPAAAKKKQRGRETALDMVRSLGLVMLVVVPLWFLAQPGDGAEQEVREVDQSADLRAWAEAVPGGPAPDRAPAGWRPTVSDYSRSPVGLRLGWNTAGRQYAEFAATTGPREPFVEDLAGREQDGTVDVDGVAWARYTEPDGSISLVRSFDDVTVVVGTRRGTGPLEEVVALARSVRANG